MKNWPLWLLLLCIYMLCNIQSLQESPTAKAWQPVDYRLNMATSPRSRYLSSTLGRPSNSKDQSSNYPTRSKSLDRKNSKNDAIYKRSIQAPYLEESSGRELGSTFNESRNGNDYLDYNSQYFEETDSQFTTRSRGNIIQRNGSQHVASRDYLQRGKTGNYYLHSWFPVYRLMEYTKEQFLLLFSIVKL